MNERLEIDWPRSFTYYFGVGIIWYLFGFFKIRDFFYSEFLTNNMFQESKTPFYEVLNFVSPVLLVYFSLITGLQIATLSSLGILWLRVSHILERTVLMEFSRLRVGKTKCCKFPIHFLLSAPSYENMHSHKPLQVQIFLHLPSSLLEDTWWADVDHAIMPNITALIVRQLLTTLL